MGTKVYLSSDNKYIGEVVDIESNHTFPDGSNREGVKISTSQGSIWIPRETAKNIYVTDK